MGSAQYFAPTAPGTQQHDDARPAVFRLGDKSIVMKSLPSEIPLQSAILTGAGVEVLQLVAPARADAETVEALCAYFNEWGAVIEISEA